MDKNLNLKGSIMAGIIQILACIIVYKFNIPNPNIVLFVLLSASIVQFGYFAGIISGVIAVLYSAFFFSTDHSWIFYTPINRDKLIVIVLGVIANIIVVGHLQKVNRQAVHKIAKLESEKKQKEKMEGLNATTVALSDIYTGVFLINLVTDTFVPIKAEDEITKILDGYSSAQQAISIAIKKTANVKNQQDMLKFVDLNTLPQRMDSQRYLSKEYRGVYSGWVRGNFVEVSRDDRGILTQVLYTYQVIDEEKKKELEQQETLRKAVIAADTANRAKSTFLLNMSHDIRTPLNGIIGLLKINMTHSDDEKLVRENYKKMEKAANHLLSLINDVLQMSKLEDGREEFSPELVCLSDIFYDIKAIIEGNASDKGISWDFSGDIIFVHPYVIASPLHLRQIFLNIYGNSIKFTNPGGKISTKQECIEEKDNVITYRWIISDTGIGMSKEFLQHIFEPFSQEQSDARSAYHGTGLGMSIVKKLVDNMGGTISITSEIGKGSTFVIELPFEMASAPEKSKKEEVEKENSIRGLNLMLVEDNELNAEIAEMLLKDEGAIIIMANDGQQAVGLFNNNPVGTFDAILMDIMMPVMDGLSATKAIRALNRPDAGTVPIIAMTANAFAEDAQKCLEAGMNAHLAKPLDIEKVKKIIYEQTKNRLYKK